MMFTFTVSPGGDVMTGRTRREGKLLALPAYTGVTPLELVGPLTVLRNLTGTA